MDGAKFIVILLGAIAGLIVIRFLAGYFVKILSERPSLENVQHHVNRWLGRG